MAWVRRWIDAWRRQGASSVPALAFSGFGDAPIVFTDYTGVVLTPPASAPDCGPGCDGFVKLAGAGTGWGVVGGNAPTFPTTGTGIFSADFSSAVDSAAGANGYAGNAGGRDGLGNFYSCGEHVGRWIFRYNSAGLQTGSFNVGGAPGEQPVACGVNAAGTIAYFVRNTTRDTIRAWDLVGNVSLGVFATNVGFQLSGQVIATLANGHVLVGWAGNAGSGYIREYDAAGATVQTYTLAGTNTDPVWLSNGATDGSVWVGYYNDDVITPTGLTVAEIAIGTGTVLHTFDPGGAFEYDGAAAVGQLGATGAAIGSWGAAWRD